MEECNPHKRIKGPEDGDYVSKYMRYCSYHFFSSCDSRQDPEFYHLVPGFYGDFIYPSALASCGTGQPRKGTGKGVFLLSEFL